MMDKNEGNVSIAVVYDTSGERRKIYLSTCPDIIALHYPVSQIPRWLYMELTYIIIPSNPSFSSSASAASYVELNGDLISIIIHETGESG
jgi:hypothetical protein